MRALAAPRREPLQLADYEAKANSADVRADAPPFCATFTRDEPESIQSAKSTVAESAGGRARNAEKTYT